MAGDSVKAGAQANLSYADHEVALPGQATHEGGDSSRSALAVAEGSR
jgi:hypothetical protein